MKRCKKFLLVSLAMFLLGSCSCSGHSDNSASASYDPLEPTLDKLVFTLSSDGESYIASAKQVAKERATGPIVIPSTYEGKPVIVGYVGTPFVVSVLVLDGVKTIFDGAFSNAEALKTVTLPSSVTSIGKNIIGGATRFKLEEITLPFVGSDKDHLYDFSYLYDYEKSEESSTCNQLKRVNINSDITSLADSTFKDLKALEEVNLPSSITSIGSYAFSGCSALKAFYNSNLKLSEVGHHAFSSCNALTSININWDRVEKNTFELCSNLKSVNFKKNVALNEYSFKGCAIESLNLTGVIEARANAFSMNTALKNLLIPSSCVLDSDTFSGCTSLKNVEIEHGVTSFPNNLFANTAIENISFPASVLRLGDYLFKNCSRLKVVELYSGLEEIGRQVFANTSDVQIKFHGTSEDWDKIVKDPLWDAGSTDLVIEYLE